MDVGKAPAFSLYSRNKPHKEERHKPLGKSRAAKGENPLQLDSQAPKIPLEKYMYMENRFKMLTKSRPKDAKRLLQEAQDDVNARWKLYEYLAARKLSAE